MARFLKNNKWRFQKGHPKPQNAYSFSKGHKFCGGKSTQFQKGHPNHNIKMKGCFKKGMIAPMKGKENLKIQKKKHWNWKGGITPKIIKRCNSIWWKELRKLIYKRDNWTCRMCNKKCHYDIQCHHIIPERIGGNHKPENLVTLCRKCHGWVDACQEIENRKEKKNTKPNNGKEIKKCKICYKLYWRKFNDEDSGVCQEQECKEEAIRRLIRYRPKE